MDQSFPKRAPRARRRAGFTLVELLVVISIIALLLGLLLPSLAGAREAAHGVVCQANLKSIGAAQQAYISENRGALAGSPATTAQDLLNDPEAAAGDAIRVRGAATQPWDWAAPLLFGFMSDGSQMPRDRPERFNMLNGTDGFENPLSRSSGAHGVLACPSNRVVAAPFVGDDVRPAGTPEFPATLAFSYQSGRDILWGAGPAPGGNEFRPSWARQGFWATDPSNGQCAYPGFSDLTLPGGSGYRPTINRLAQPASKIFVADGTRFQKSDLRLVDHDTDSNAGFGGAFADIGAWNIANTRAYPPGTNAVGWNMSGISFRHGATGSDTTGEGSQEQGNAVFYDGHVERLSLAEARRPEYWVPSDSKVNWTALSEELRAEYSSRVERGREVRIP